MNRYTPSISLVLCMLCVVTVSHGEEPDTVLCCAACSLSMTVADDKSSAGTALVDLDSIDKLKASFNAAAGSPRLILLLSPTCPVCVDGAEWVQQEIFQKYPELDLKTFVVWMPILPTDTRDKWDASLIDDARASHYWNDDKSVGKWFAENVESCESLGPVAWDAYYVFDPEADWRGKLDMPSSCKAPVIRHADEFADAIAGIVDDRDRETAAK